MSRIKISDVARLAGVSAMTVSRVINGGASVGVTTRTAVLKAVDVLGYVPNPAARKLASGGIDRIGLIYSNPSAGYLSAFLLGALEGVQGLDAQLIVEPCGEDADSEMAALRRLAAGGVRAVILPPPHGESHAVLQEAARLEMRLVAVADGGFPSGVAAVRIDDRAAAAEMTRHLLALGHRHIGFISGATNQTASAERQAGFLHEMSLQSGTRVEIEAGAFTYRSGFEAGERLLDRSPRPTAIFASNDDMAAGVLAAAHRRGLDVPAEVSVAGFDDTEIATSVWPTLTTMRQPIARMAAEAVALAGQGDHSAAVIRIPHELVPRQTTAPLIST